MIWTGRPALNFARNQLGSYLFGRQSTRNTFTLYNVTNETIANKIVMKAFNKQDAIIMPCSGPINPVIKELLATNNFRTLTLCEPNDKARKNLKIYIRDNHPSVDNVDVISDDILSLTMDYSNEISQEVCSNIVNKCSSSEKNGGSIKLYIPLLKRKHEPALLTNLYCHTAQRIGLSAKYLINYCVIFSDRQYQHIIARPGTPVFYKAVTVKFNTFFDVTKLMTIRTDHDLTLNHSKIKTYKMRKFASRDSHLVYITPKVELIESLSDDWMGAYDFFLNQILFKRTKSMYAATRMMFDVSDEEFELLDIKPEMRTADVEVDQYFKLFLYLRSRPGYKSSILHEALGPRFKLNT